MPHRNTVVKQKTSKKPIIHSQISIGAVDIHFHGAFGIDLMTANQRALDKLSRKLWNCGVAAFCPTTLSVDKEFLLGSVFRLGKWIRGRSFEREFTGAIPLGIHLEGPFIHPEACGAHPPGQVRRFDWRELERLWQASQETLKILTLAPEVLRPDDLPKLVLWCERRKIRLSLGHSRASEEEARQALESGFHGITHAWNALRFHHRSPGPLGAAIGFPGRYLELILDGVHVSPTVVRWTRKLHLPQPLCFVSDCVPAAATAPARSSRPGPWFDFGPLKIRYHTGACRLRNGELAGGGRLLSEAFCHWVTQGYLSLNGSRPNLKQAGLDHLNRDPLRVLGVSPRKLKDRKVRWSVQAGILTCNPLS